MKKKLADQLGLVVGSGKKTPEELQRRLQQRAHVVPATKEPGSRRRGKGRRAWDNLNEPDN